MLKTDVFSGGVETISVLSGEWTALCEEGASNVPFLRPEWFVAFVENFELSVELITVRRDGRLRAVLPLLAQRSSLHGLPVRKLQAVYNLNTQRFDLVHGSDESEKREIIQAIWNVLKGRRGWSVVEFRLIPRNSWLADLLELAEQDKYPTGIWKMDGAPFLTLPGSENPRCSINEYLKGSRKQLRQQLDRRKRRLDEEGKTELIITRTYTPALVDTFLDLETRGWKGRDGTAAIYDEKVARLHHDFTKSMSDIGALLAFELRLNNETIAMSINLRTDSSVFHWKTTFDEKYSKFSPGNLLFKMLVAHCLDNDVEKIDLLSPSTTNKSYWMSGEREHLAFYVFAPGVAGKALWLWKFGIIAGLRALKVRVQGKSLEVAPANKQA